MQVDGVQRADSISTNIGHSNHKSICESSTQDLDRNYFENANNDNRYGKIDDDKPDTKNNTNTDACYDVKVKCVERTDNVSTVNKPCEIENKKNPKNKSW